MKKIQIVFVYKLEISVTLYDSFNRTLQGFCIKGTIEEITNRQTRSHLYTLV